MLKRSPYEDVLRALDEMLELWERKRTHSKTVQNILILGRYEGHEVNTHYEEGLQKAYSDCIANLKSVVKELSR